MALTSINGDIFSWASHELLCEIFKVRGCVGLDFAEKIENEYVHADNQDGTPVGMTYGKYTPDDISLRILRTNTEAWLNFLLTLAPLSLGSYGAARFTLTSKLFEPSLTGIAGASVTTLDECRIVGKKDTREEGTGALITEFTIRCMRIMENGKTMYDRSRGLL